MKLAVILLGLCALAWAQDCTPSVQQSGQSVSCLTGPGGGTQCAPATHRFASKLPGP
jgi:hypothetical protein